MRKDDRILISEDAVLKTLKLSKSRLYRLRPENYHRYSNTWLPLPYVKGSKKVFYDLQVLTNYISKQLLGPESGFRGAWNEDELAAFGVDINVFPVKE